jgi:DHA1 family multidrug resistance protein-like MFS transporter
MLSPFYLSAFVWNLAHGMTNMLVPLYALELGMSGVRIGSLVALPVVLQLVFNLIGGAYVDRLGAKNILYASCAASVLASAVYVISESYAGLMLGQCLFVLSRASFWPANWSLGSQLPGERNRNMGRLNSTTNAGQIAGTAAAGLLISAIGFKSSFWVAALDGIVAFVLTSAISYTHDRHGARSSGMLATYRSLARMPALYFAMACGFLSVLPFTLISSFGAILLVSEGYSSGATGWLLTLRAIGAIFAGAVLAQLLRSAFDRRVPIACCVAMALGMALVAAFENPWPIGVFLFLLGISSGVISVYFQLLISAVSSSAQRGSAMSYGGVGWNLSNMSAPLLMGALMDAQGVRAAFYVMGVLLIGFALMLMPLYRWAFPLGGPSDSR